MSATYDEQLLATAEFAFAENGQPSTRSSLVLKRTVSRGVMRLEGCEEPRLNWTKWIRQTHRWLSMAFTLAVIVNIVGIAVKKYSNGLGLLAVAPLAFLFLSGLYLFVLPYVANKRRKSQPIIPQPGSSRDEPN